MRWLLGDIPNGRKRADAGELCGGTIDSWLLWKLTGGAVHACDVTNASRTQLLNLQTVSWDDDLLALFEIPAAMLPAVRPSSGVCGHVTAIPALAGTPIAAMIGDSHAALFGHAAFEPGQVKATYGTGSSLMTPLSAPVRSRHGLSTTIAWSVGGDLRYALEGNITVTGSAVDWMSAIVGGQDRSSAGVAALATSVADTGGVYFVPALAGLGAPYWDADARGLVCGLSRGTSAAHLARASVESIAYQVRDVFDAMGEDTGSPSALLVDGGASMNDALMQFQADILGCPVVRAEAADLSAIGAAWIAGLAIGVWASPAELEALPRRRTGFHPQMAPGDRERLYDGWRAAVRRHANRRSARIVARLDELRLIGKVARMYYRDGLRQAQITERLNVHQSTVSRLLRRAEKEGIVRVTLTMPSGLHAELEEALQAAYGLREAIVVDAHRPGGPDRPRSRRGRGVLPGDAR